MLRFQERLLFRTSAQRHRNVTFSMFFRKYIIHLLIRAGKPLYAAVDGAA
jgi:hypothetical protein